MVNYSHQITIEIETWETDREFANDRDFCQKSTYLLTHEIRTIL